MQEMLIHIFINRLDSLENIGKSRHDPLAYCISKAGENTDLGRYLKNVSVKSKGILVKKVRQITQNTAISTEEIDI